MSAVGTTIDIDMDYSSEDFHSKTTLKIVSLEALDAPTSVCR